MTSSPSSRLSVAVILLTVFFVIMGSVACSAADPGDDAETWPVRDDEGYYMSYKEGGKWVNWWARNRPSFLGFGAGFATAADRSVIPGSKEELDTTLPVRMYKIQR